MRQALCARPHARSLCGDSQFEGEGGLGAFLPFAQNLRVHSATEGSRLSNGLLDGDSVKTSIARKKISHQQLKFFKDILQELEDLAASDRPEAQDLFGALEQQNPFGQDPHHDVPCQAQCQRWCSSFTKWESRQTPRPRVNTLGKFLPLPMTLSAEERKLTEWAFSLAPSSDKPWHDIKKANRKAWLWVLIFAISFLYGGSLSPLNEKQRCYKSVSQY